MAAAATASSTSLHLLHDDSSSVLSSRGMHLRSSSLALITPRRTSSPSPLIQFSPKGLANPLLVAATEKKKSPFQTEAILRLTDSQTKAVGFRFAIVVAKFNENVTEPLMKGALDTFREKSVKKDHVDVVWVPGSFEIGLVAEKLGKSGKYNAIVCIGAVVRGDTHYDAVANSAAFGVLSAGLNSGVPCIFGVLTCEDMDQALDLAGGKKGNKGSEAALTAIEMASLFEHHLKFLCRSRMF